MSSDRPNVILERCSKCGWRQRIGPCRYRSVPDQRVTADLHAVRLEISCNRVATRKTANALALLDRGPLHCVLGGQITEMPTQDTGVARVAKKARLCGRANEFAGGGRGVLERIDIRGRGRRRSRRGRTGLLIAP